MAQPETTVGIFLFDRMTMLDAYAPLQFLSFVPDFETFTFAKRLDPATLHLGAAGASRSLFAPPRRACRSEPCYSR